MKRFLLILAAILALLAVGAGIFMATFDADRYRPLLVSKLEAALGRPVTLERVSLGWRRGIALELKGFAIHEGRDAGQEPLIQMDSASALLGLMPLLRRELRISSVSFDRPRIHVARDAQGAVNLTGLAAAADRGGTVPAAEEVPRRDGAAADRGGTVPAAEAGRDGAPAAGPHTNGVGMGAGGAAPSAGSAVAFRVASLRIEDGTVHWTDALSRPPAELWLKALDATVTNIAPGEPMAITLSGAVAGEEPNLRLSGRLIPPDGRQPGSLDDLQITLERVPLGDLLGPAASGEPQLRGSLTVTITGRAGTLEPAELLRAVSGEGTLRLEQPVIANLNVLRAVFEKLSMLPGLVQALEARLPPEYQAKLAARDTVLEPIDLTVHADAGRLQFDDLNVRSDTFGLSGRGRVDADGTINVGALLRIEPQLSSAIVRSVNELQALANPQGELELPLTVQGGASRVAVRPDLQYVASRVVVRKAVDFLGELLKADTPQASDQPGTDQTHQGAGGLLDQFLKKALESSGSR